jgi:flavin-binding protein dodecin
MTSGTWCLKPSEYPLEGSGPGAAVPVRGLANVLGVPLVFKDGPQTGCARQSRGAKLSNHTYSISEIVGTSDQGVDDAVRNGIAKASQTLRNLDWFEVKEIRGHLEEGKIADWQVTIKLGFRLEDH